MSHTHRTTRECTLAELRPELAEAIRAYAQRQHWPNLEAEVLAGCETTTEQINTNWLDAWLNSGTPALAHLALLATPQRLIWASSSERGNVGVASAPYKEMSLKIHLPKLTPGIAVEVYARMDETHQKTGGRFMLDDSPAARHFCEEVKRATDPLYQTETGKPRRKWFGR